MKFDKARNLVKLLLAMCIVFCTAGIITNGSQAGAISALISVLFFIMAFIVISLYCKCPNWRQANIPRPVQGGKLPTMQTKPHNRRKKQGKEALKG